MILKQMDAVIQSGQFDCGDNSPTAAVVLTSPELDAKLIHWHVIDQITVDKRALQYDDTDDGSNKLLRSYQKYYCGEGLLSEATLYNGSSMMFKNGRSAFGGIAKAAIYLRYSKGIDR